MAKTETDIRAFGRLAAREIECSELEMVAGGQGATSTSTWHPDPIGDDKDDDFDSGYCPGDFGDTDQSDPTAPTTLIP